MVITKQINKEDILSREKIEALVKDSSLLIDLHEDEIFVKVRFKDVLYDNYYVSNYGKIISFCRKKPIVLKMNENKPNKRKRCEIYIRGESKKPYIYQLVAEAFCEQPYNPKNEKTVVHHLNKYDTSKSIEENDRADNLIILLESDHKIFDIIQEIRLTYLPSIKVDATGILISPPKRKTITRITDLCNELNIDMVELIKLLREEPKYIGEVAETHIKYKYLINIIKTNPRINKNLNLTEPALATTLDRW